MEANLETRKEACHTRETLLLFIPMYRVGCIHLALVAIDMDILYRRYRRSMAARHGCRRALRVGLGLAVEAADDQVDDLQRRHGNLRAWTNEKDAFNAEQRLDSISSVDAIAFVGGRLGCISFSKPNQTR